MITSAHIGAFIGEFWQLFVFLGGLLISGVHFYYKVDSFILSANENFKSVNKKQKEDIIKMEKYVDLKTSHMSDQIDGVEKSVNLMCTTIDNLSKRIDRVLDKMV